MPGVSNSHIHIRNEVSKGAIQACADSEAIFQISTKDIKLIFVKIILHFPFGIAHYSPLPNVFHIDISRKIQPSIE